MSALKGALSVILLHLSWYVCPQDQDPAFAALPVSARVFFVFAVAMLIVAGALLFLWGLDDQYGPKPSPAEQGGDDEQRHQG